MSEEALQVRRHAEHRGRPVLGDGLGDPGGIEGPRQHHAAAGQAGASAALVGTALMRNPDLLEELTRP